MNEREVGRLVVMETISCPRNWGDPGCAFWLGVFGCWEGDRRSVQRRGQDFGELPRC